MPIHQPTHHTCASQARTQHVDNLLAVLEEGLLQGQYSRVAEAASTLVPLTVSMSPPSLCMPSADQTTQSKRKNFTIFFVCPCCNNALGSIHVMRAHDQ